MLISPSRQALPLLLAAVSMAACGGGGAPLFDGAATDMAADPSEAKRPQVGPALQALSVDVDRATTSGSLAAANLDSQIDALTEHYERTAVAAVRERMVNLLSLRASMLGTYDDFERIDELTAAGLEAGGASAVRQRAAYLRAVHRFRAAEALLDGADGDGAGGSFLHDRLTIDLAVGRNPERLVDDAEAAAAADSSYGAQVLLAGALAAAGRFEAADAMYQAALSDYRDVSPFIVAWNAFQRGVMWGEAADRPDLAMALYREAVRRLPGYVVANVHLAELEAEAGALSDAVARLRTLVVAKVQDPEPYGLLAELLGAAGTAGAEAEVDAEVATLLATARRRYEVLLDRHPEAFADHGSEFFAGVGGDPQRGLALSLFNLDRRSNPRAYVVAIEAAEAAGDQRTMCAVAAESAPWRARHPVLSGLGARLDCPADGQRASAEHPVVVGGQ